MQICRQGATRLERVVEEVADYTRGKDGTASAAPVDLARLVRATADLVGRTAERAPAFVLELPALPTVRGDEAALARVFVNLFRNAVDALADVADPVVRVTAGLGASDAGSHVEVRVADNGPGVPLRDRFRIFEPFVTTKPAGRGLGLGLAIAREIVEASGGTIELAGGRFAGTEFLIRLPVAP